MLEKEKSDIAGSDNEDDSSRNVRKLPEAGSPERILAERRLVRKLDMRLLPTIFLIFIMNYVDRNGVTTARLKGMQQDLRLSDVQYSTVIAILFVSYCPAQIPSNMAFAIYRHMYMSVGLDESPHWCMITKNFAGIIACRIFIGLPESAFYPGAIFLLSRWYTKKELAFRSAFLYVGLLISNAFGTLLAAGILANMEGKRGIRAWRWWLLPDYPHNTRGMSSFECKLAQVRLSEDAGEADLDNETDSRPLRGLVLAVKDPKVSLFAVMTIAQLLGLSFVQYFPTLTQTLGFNTTATLLLASPPWILAAILCFLNAWHADKTGERFFHMAGWWLSVVIGYIIAFSTTSVAARYISLFFMAGGYAGSAITLVWVSNTMPRPPAKRAAAIAIVNGVGNTGMVMGSYTWKAAWAPNYHQSMAVSLGALVISVLLSLVIRQMLVRENKRLDADEKAFMEDADQTRIHEAANLEGITFEQAMQRRKGYRYLY
ncbi:hypothetical protein CVT25_006301 [Psilocybe cyanescens]|uniref:Major facilitator superfamily (MFS) profile domain-containing protein n=1 Tax=Psilocybe cyanescens TaxID=93625 RepID=A0A409WYQ5_PSICY|nr:hypothetical protein CVT25_006301 [Psilocybe cyanescens]